MENNHERFKRIASKRTNEIIDKIRILGNCSNKSTYKYDEQEIGKIFAAIEQELKRVKTKFLSANGRKNKFKL